MARLSVSPRKLAVGQLVTADGSASTDDKGIVSYLIAWGDGQTTNQPIATHSYTSTGNRKVVLTVTDTAGQKTSTQVPVQVR